MGISADAIWGLAELLNREIDTRDDVSNAMVSRIDVDGKAWVRLDGSSMDTPVNGGTRVTIAQNDAVLVSIKNGVCTITNNRTHPNATSSDISTVNVSVNQLDEKTMQNFAAVNGVIENLEIDTAKIHSLSGDQLAFTVGVFDNLTADEFDANKMSALVGFFTTLTVEKEVTAEKISATTGFYDNLTAKEVTADKISSGVGFYDELTAKNLNANNISAGVGFYDQLTAKEIDADKLAATTGYVDDLVADNVTTNKIAATTGYIDDLTTKNITTENINAATAFVGDLYANSITTEDIQAATGYIDQLTTNNVTASNIQAATAFIGDLDAENVTAADIAANKATIDELDSNYAHITHLDANTAVIDNATIDQAKVNNLSANYAAISLANVNNAWVKNGVIDTAAIVDEQVFTVTGNKATITEINAEKISVNNLNAKNLKIETADGYVTIGNKKTPTKEFIDSLVDDIQDKIDSTVETFTSSAVPLTSNYPANQWTTDDERLTHVGDICFVTNSAAAENGFCYRYAYDSTNQTFSWVLIKDNDVTKALGDISTLQTFKSDTESWIEETDSGLRTIRENHTTLSGIVDKTVKASTQLWFTKANTTAPSAPTAQVTTNNASTANKWNLAVPSYNASYPNYFYCWQYRYADDTYGWSAVIRDVAMGESQERARTAITNAAAADTKAGNAQTAAAGAQTTANTANTNAAAAQSTANANIKSSVQLWYTSNSTTPPAKPTAKVTATSTTANAWTNVVPTYSASTPNYHYCYQQQLGNGNWQWTDPTYDSATSVAMEKAQKALPSSTFSTFQTTTFKELVDEVDEQSSTITTLSETTEGLSADFANLQVGGRNLLPKSNVRQYGTAYTESNYVYQFESRGATISGLRIPDSVFEVGEDYVLSFKFKKVSGTLNAIGGHSEGFTTNSFVVDNVVSGIIYSSGYVLDDDMNVHSVVVKLRYNGDASDNSLYIQPNRHHRPPSDVTSVFQIWDIKLEIGNMPTAWTPAPEDMATSASVTTLSNTVNTVKQTADSNIAKITNLTTTLGTNADGTTNVLDVVHRTSAVEQDLSGFKTTVSETYSTKTSANPNVVSYFQTSVENTDYWGSTHARNEAKTDSEGLHALYDAQEYGNGIGWAHVTLDSRQSAGNQNKNCYMNLHLASGTLRNFVKPNSVYTWVIEVSGLNMEGTNGLRIQPSVGENTLDVFSAASNRLIESDGTYYSVVTSKSDFSGLGARDTRGYCYLTPNCYADFYLRVSLFEGEYSGPWKPYVPVGKINDLGSRVTTAETSIQQNSDSIALKATRTEVNNAFGAVNLSPYFSYTPYSKNTYWNGWNANTNASGTTFTPMGDGWVRVQCANAGTSTIRRDVYPIKSEYVKEGADYTWLVEFRNNHSTSGNGNKDVAGICYLVQVGNCQFWGGEIKKNISGGSSSSATNLNTHVPYNNEGVYEKRFVKVSEATGSSHWTDGSADKVVGLATFTFQTYAGCTIDFEVRISVYEGEYTGPYRPYVGTLLYSTQASLELKANKDTLTSEINASADTVTINADRVNIAGATIFTEGRLSENSLNGAYDAKGSAASVQSNLDNLQVGGKNLFLNSDVPSKWRHNAPTSYSICSLYLSENLEKGSTYTLQIWGTVSRSDKTSPAFTAFWGGGNVSLGSLTPNSSKNYWTRTFVAPNNSHADTGNLFIDVYNTPPKGASDTTYTSNVIKAKIEKGSKPTDWTPAPEDINANANNREQTIYRSAADGTSSIAANTTWVTASGDTQNAWTTRRPTYDKSYPVLFVAYQRQTVAQSAGTTCSCTTPTIDNTTTVIDGGRIITGSVTANKLNAQDINASKMLTVGSFTDADSANILNSNVSVGGRNLLGNTANAGDTINPNAVASSTFGTIGSYNDPADKYSFEDYDGYSMSVVENTTNTGNRGVGWYTKAGEIRAGETYTFSCQIKTSISVSVHTHTAWRNNSATASYVGWTNNGGKNIPADTWIGYSYTFVPDSSAYLDGEFMVALCFSGNSNGVIAKFAHAKLECGNVATDWSPAPEDQRAYVDNMQIGGRNLLLWTEDLPKGSSTNLNAKDGIATWSAATMSALVETDDGIKVTFNGENNSCIGVPLAVNGSVKNDEAVMLSFEARGNITSVGQFFWIQESGSNISYTNWLNGSSSISLNETTWTMFTTSIPTSDANVRTCVKILLFYGLKADEYKGKWVEIRKKSMKLEKGTKATDWSPAPEDVSANAVRRTQRIYYRSNTGTKPTAMPTAWVTETGDKYNANATTATGWSTKVTPITSSVESTTKYLYLWTCEQREMMDGTLAYTNVLLDDSTTIIDGGNIITGTVTANQLNATNINGSGMLTIGSLSSDTQSGILNSEMSIGGRNIVLGTDKNAITNTTATTSYTTVHLYGTLSGSNYSAYPTLADLGFSAGDKVTMSFDWNLSKYGENDIVYGNFRIEFYGRKGTSENTYINYFDKIPIATMSASNTSGHYEGTVALTSATVLTKRFALRIDKSALTLTIRNFKLERGNKATDWSPAPEDVSAAITSVESSLVNAMNGFTILWDTNIGTQYAGGEAMICLRDPVTGTVSSGKDGWVMFNGTKRTVPHGDFNPNAALPYNIPIYMVFRLSDATSTTGAMHAVFYQSGWKCADKMSQPSTTYTDWTWENTTDIILGKCVEPSSEAVFTDCEIYDPPLTTQAVSNNTVTASSAQATANTANNKLVAFRGSCSTAAGTAAKVVACNGFALSQGYSITVYNTTAQTVAGAITLNVNSLGAKAVWVAGAATSDTNRLYWSAGSSVTFVYDGTQFRVSDNPGSYYGTTCSVAETTAAKTTTVNDSVIFKGVAVSVPMTNTNTAASPTLNVSALGACNIYYGTSTTGPTKANGYAWPAGTEIIFIFDGKFWRCGNQTFINGGNILTGTIAADKLNVNDINAKSLLTIGALSTSTQDSILNSNITIGGRNVLLNSSTPSKFLINTPNEYEVARFQIASGQELVAGQWYTVQIWGYNYNRKSINAYVGGGSYNVASWMEMSSNGDLHVSFTFNATALMADAPQHIRIYASNNIGTQGSTTISGSFTVVKAKLERGNKATDWSPAPEDVSADSTKRTQRIYYRSNVNTKPTAMPTAWVTETGNKYNTNATTASGWSTKVTPVSSSVDSSTKYIYLWTCEQREMADGTIAYTNVLLDDSMTVIDGGNIATGTITANKLNVNDINTKNSLTIGALSTSTQDSILNSNVQIGGRNLLIGTGNPVMGNSHAPKYAMQSGGDGTGSIVDVSDSPVQGVSRAYRITGNTSGNKDFGQIVDDLKVAWNGSGYNDTEWVFSAYVRAIDADCTALVRVYEYTHDRHFYFSSTVGTSWTRIEVPIKLTGTTYSGGEFIMMFGLTGSGKIEYIAPKLERGNKATTWSPAPEDVDNSINNLATAMNGFTILWDSNRGTEYAGGEAAICLRDPLTGTVSSGQAGWVMFNGVKRTVPNASFNPNTALPYNIPIYMVLRLSSATSTTGTMYAVFYQSGWKRASAMSSPTTTYTDWTWADATDIILGKCVEPSSEAVFTDCEIYDPPLTTQAVSSNTITASLAKTTADSAQTAATNAAKTATNYITYANATDGIKVTYNGTNAATQITSEGVSIINSSNERVAQFGDSVRLGKSSGAYFECDYHSMRFVTEYGAHIHLSDQRNSKGIALIKMMFIGDGSTTTFRVDLVSPPINVVEVKNAEDSSNSSNTYSYTLYSSRLDVTFSTAPSNNATVIVSFTSDGFYPYAYTIGERGLANPSALGFLSYAMGFQVNSAGACTFAEGYQTTACNKYSHAEGCKTKALGLASHASGNATIARGQMSYAGGQGTIANGWAQTVVGRYNVVDSNHQFIVGIGVADDWRITGMYVSDAGNLWINGNLTQNSDRRLKTHHAYLGKDACTFMRKLRPALFTKDGERHLGFYAQDVQEAEPENWDTVTVKPDHTNESLDFDPLTLDYTAIIAPLTAYAQQLEKRIEYLEYTVDSLVESNEELREMVETLIGERI